MAQFTNDEMQSLTDALKHEDATVRCQTLWKLITLCGAQNMDAMIETLIGALQDKDFSVRSVALSTLGNVRDRRIRRAMNPLITAMKKEQDFGIQMGFANALRKIVGGAADFGCNAAMWENWWREHQNDIDYEKG